MTPMPDPTPDLLTELGSGCDCHPDRPGCALEDADVETPVSDTDLAAAARITAALRRVVALHQPEAVDLGGVCDRYDEPGSGCCGACDLTTTTTVCTCGAGLDLMSCPTLAVIGDELGVVLDEDAAPALLAGLLREHLDGLAAETAPQVWLPGDTVPAGVVVTDGSWTSSVAHAYRPSVAVVEVLIPDLAAVVAAEEARRAAGGAS